ncbi:MAG: hypothetical protein JWP26_2123 [Devosia sp.]|nr:hypothetical protein [Devosia sp.]
MPYDLTHGRNLGSDDHGLSGAIFEHLIPDYRPLGACSRMNAIGSKTRQFILVGSVMLMTLSRGMPGCLTPA